MKITIPGRFTSGRITSSATRTGQTTGSKFLDQLQQAADSGQTTGTCPTGFLPEIRSTRFIPAAYGDDPIIKKASDTLDLFESYICQLSDSSATLKEIEPTLNDLVREAQTLYASCTESDTCPLQLKQILEQLLMETRLEQFKFQRGDYVDSL